MNKLFRLLCLVVFLAPSFARADLAKEVDALLNDRLLKKAAVGVEIIKLSDTPAGDVTVYRKDAMVPLIPASNLKLLSTAAALHKLGTDYKFRTSFLVGDGDVALVGGGDPTFGDSSLLKDRGWDVTTVFESWADELARRGIRSVRDVLIDDSIFEELSLHPNWPIDQIQKKYQAEVGGFNLNANLLEFSVRPTRPGQVVTYTTNPPATNYADVRNSCITGKSNAIWLSRQPGTNQVILRGETPSRAQLPVAVTIHDPSMYAATVFSEVLKRKGIAVTGSVRRDRTIAVQQQQSPERWRVLTILETPLVIVLNRANKDSVNLYAESLCKIVGHASTNQPGSWQNGTAALGAFLRSIGVTDSEFKIDDGCGLSKQNAISAEALSKILTYNFHSPHRDVFRASLAVAGQDGTMDDRFRGSDLRGRVFAKSGYVANVRALSGYLSTRDGQWYVFSILMNRVPDGGEVKLIQEKIVKAVDNHAASFAAGN